MTTWTREEIVNEKAVTAWYWRVVDQLDSSKERSWRQQKMSSPGKSDTSVIRQGITSPWRTKHKVACHQIGITKKGLCFAWLLICLFKIDILAAV